MSGEATTARKCSRCGTTVERCAFCDEPDCPAITCHRCLSLGLHDRLRTEPTISAPTQK